MLLDKHLAGWAPKPKAVERRLSSATIALAIGGWLRSEVSGCQEGGMDLFTAHGDFALGGLLCSPGCRLHGRPVETEKAARCCSGDLDSIELFCVFITHIVQPKDSNCNRGNKIGRGVSPTYVAMNIQTTYRNQNTLYCSRSQ